MSRILWLFALLVISGAHKHDDKWKQDMRALVDELTRQMSQSLQKSFGLYYEDFRDGSHPYSTASSVVHTEGEPADHKPTRKPSESSTKSYPTESSSTGDAIKNGSLKGIPGHNFPDYTDIPLTSFTCSDKGYIPGFYADLDTGCQVFHVCWPHRRESFLCPVGTTFNQALLACDYWYSSNCSLSPHYYDVNGFSMKSDSSGTKDHKTSMIDVLLGTGQESSTGQSYTTATSESDSDMSFVSRFLPVKAQVTIYPGTEDAPSKIVATASVGAGKKYKLKEYPKLKKPEHKSKAPEYISESKLPVEPRTIATSEPSVIVRTINVEEATKYFMDRADQMIQHLIKDLKETPCSKEAQGKKNAEKQSVTKLNQKFVVNPISTPQNKAETLSRSKKLTVSESTSRGSEDFVADSSEKQTETRTRPKLNILPMTKKALVENYVRFLNTRKA